MNRILPLLLILILACTEKSDMVNPSPLFEKIHANQSGVTFSNDLQESDTLNYFNYGYIYMGGGVAIADFNNDGFKDLYFTGNMVENKLYLGNGDLSFQDVTKAAGVGGGSSWMQGVTVCDINADGKPDIYVSVSGKTEKCPNLLFVNTGSNADGTPIFTEQASRYGLDDAGHSTNSTFFDYDNDGDLDLYVINYPITEFETPAFVYSQMRRNAKMRDSDQLYRNNGDGTFSNVTLASGILNHGLSLGISATDFNSDGWKDLYISNDFASPDLLYLNNQDGTFSEVSQTATRQTSYYGMGVDVADINNDGLMDIFQADMAPEDNRRSKENMSGMNPEGFYEMIDLGLHHQYMYNALQLNMGLTENDQPTFSNIAWMAGVSSTDWSWSPLIADFDNNGWKDLFVSNGTRRDINNNDYFKKLKKEKSVYFKKEKANNELENVKKMPSEAISNYIFSNNKDLTFTNKTKDWGLDEKTFSNGATYSDLDNDGDLDLIINNIDGQASIYRNNSDKNTSNNWVSFQFKGSSANSMALGTVVNIWNGGNQQTAELTLTRGFQSATDPSLTFGLGTKGHVDSVQVLAPGGGSKMLYDLEANQLVSVDLTSIKNENLPITTPSSPTLFTDITPQTSEQNHMENSFNDFDFQVLLPHKMSNFGPAMAVGDLNGDGLDDYYLGAARGYNGVIGLQSASGSFDTYEFQQAEDLQFEDIDAVFADFDNDGDLDLYIVSGGNEFEPESQYYQDRLFLNDKGILTKSTAILPKLTTSGACVRPADWDGDGDLDLFVGSRHTPRLYPQTPPSYLLENKLETGQLSFAMDTVRLAPKTASMGMVTDAIWTDLDANGSPDLIVVGEWMPISVFLWENGQLINKSADYLSGNTTGWWFSINGADFDHDGDTDFIVGNLGRNYKYQAKPDAPFNLYAADFDQNGKSDIVLSYHNFGNEYPVRGRSCSSEQIPAVKEKFKDYKSFSRATITDIFGGRALAASNTYKVESFSSVYLENNGNGIFTSTPLPNAAQIAPINDLIIDDFDQDGNLDIIAAGNLYASEVETPRADAGIGLYLRGDGKGSFRPISYAESGIYIPFDTKKIAPLTISKKKAFMAANNNGPLKIFQKND